MKEKWTVGLVEDEEAFCGHFIENLKDYHKVKELLVWNSAEEYIRQDMKKVDVLFLDIKLKDMSGIDLARLINEKDPEQKVVMITSMNSDEMIFQSLAVGAVGYIYKDDMYDLEQTVRQVMADGASISPTIALRVLQSFKKEPEKEGYYELTQRERQVLEIMVKGYSIRKAAGTIGISPNTLRNHVYNIYKKLNVNSRVEMVQKADRMGLI